MTTLKRYLWKEWRDHRAVAIGFAVICPLLFALTAFAVPQVRSTLLATFGAAAGLALACLSAGSDLMAGEARRQKLRFLRRMPADLRAPFLGKFLFFLSLLAAFTVYGYVTAGLVVGAVFPPLDPLAVKYLPAAALLALWIFPVSTWLPRGSLALPATLVWLGILGLPLLLLFAWNPGLHPSTGETVVFGCVLALGAPLTAWFSITRGYRHGRGHLHAAACGAGISVLLCVPAYGWAGFRVREWRHVDPYAQGFRIREGYLGKGGLAFLDVDQGDAHDPLHVLAVNLSSGKWREIGDGPGVLTTIGHLDHCDEMTSAPVPHDVLMLLGRKDRFVDGTTGAFLDRVADGRLAAEARRAAPYRNASGDPVWLFRGKLHSGKRTLPIDGIPFFSPSHGAGIVLGSRGPRLSRWYDFSRDKEFAVPRAWSVTVRPGLWSVWFRGRRFFYDPESGRKREPKAASDERLASFLGDGRLFVCPAPGGRIELDDPETGSRRPLRFEDGSPAVAFTIFDPSMIPARTPDGRRVFVVQLKEIGDQVLARFDPQTGTLVRALGAKSGWPYMHLLACPDNDTAIAIVEGKRVVRLHFGSDAVETLFPRPR